MTPAPSLVWIDSDPAKPTRYETAAHPDGRFALDAPDSVGNVDLRFILKAPTRLTPALVRELRGIHDPGSDAFYQAQAMNPALGSRLGTFHCHLLAYHVLDSILQPLGTGPIQALLKQAGFKAPRVSPVIDEGGRAYLRKTDYGEVHLSIYPQRVALQFRRKRVNQTTLILALRLQGTTIRSKPTPIFWPAGLGTQDALVQMALIADRWAEGSGLTGAVAMMPARVRR